MMLYLRLAWRNLWRHRRRTIIVTIAMAFGLSMMMSYDGLVAGFEEAIYGNAIRVLGGNMQIHAQGYEADADATPLLPLPDDQKAVKIAKQQPQVVSATRRINTSGMVTSREGAFGVTIVAIEPEAEAPLSLAAQHVIAGRYLSGDDLDMIFIGKGLADAMDVAVDDRVTMVGKAAHEQMRQRTMTVAGIYDLGMAEIEKRTIYITLKEAQDLYNLPGQSTEVVLMLKQIGQEGAVRQAIAPELPGYEIISWETSFPELQEALGTKTGVMNIFSIIILGIAGIGIMNLLLMAVYERTREIGLLGALGLKPRQITLLFLLEGAMMGIVGVVAGIALGLLINGSLKQVGLDYTSFRGITSYMALISDRIYPSWGVENLLSRSLTVLIIAILAAYYPAHEASRKEPAEALHYV